MTVPVARSGGASRVPILVVVVVLIGAGIAAGRSHTAPGRRAAAPVDAVQTASPGALTTAWYCPGLPGSFPVAQQTISLSNLGTDATEAVVTIQPDDGSEPVSRTVDVPADTVRTFSRATLAEASSNGGSTSGGATKLPTGPIVVEPLSPDVVVGQGLETNQALDLMSCATTASTDWYFAGGTTVRGVLEWLVLDNPLSTDARVDVAVRSEVGLRLLPDLQGVDVPGRTRVVIPVHDQAVRQERVALAVHAEVGRVVASETIQFGPASGPAGVASTLGVLAPAKRWWFTDGRAVSDATQDVAIANVSPIDTQVIVQALTASGIVSPVALTIPSDGVIWVQVGDCASDAKDCLRVPKNRGYELVVTDAQVPVVAQTLSRFGAGTGSLGAATSTGATDPARHWVVARTRADFERSASISVMVPGLQAAHLDVEVVHDGQVDKTPALQQVEVAANARTVLVPDASLHTDAAVVIDSDQPVVVESTIYAARDASRSSAVPTR